MKIPYGGEAGTLVDCGLTRYAVGSAGTGGIEGDGDVGTNVEVFMDSRDMRSSGDESSRPRSPPSCNDAQ